MAFQGGAIPMLGITPEFVAGLATQTASSGVPQLLGQVWKGSGQTFYGKAGQALAGGLSASAINIGLNSLLGTQVAGPQGFSLTSGNNILASVITPYVSSTVAAGINQQIEQSLSTAGPFGTILSDFSTGLVNQAFGGIANEIFSNVNLGQGTNFKMFPGGGGEPPANYEGSSYTLSDVVFSIQPANQGPQAFGTSSALDFPTTKTTLPSTNFTTMPPVAGSPTINAIKQGAITANPNLTISGTTTSRVFSNLNYGLR